MRDGKKPEEEKTECSNIGKELTRLCTSAFSNTIIATGTTVAQSSDNVGTNVNNS